jgi:antibiotic biosynthesis monooxygenase (ABM) superfamily enzyme
MDQDETGVSVVVRRRIHAELREPFEAWLEGIVGCASTFEGHLGAQILRPPDPETQDYVLLFRFATAEQLATWQSSDIAKDWLTRGREYTRGEAHIERVSGLEFWFQAPPSVGHLPPPKHKMVVATVVGLYPLILFVAPVISAPLVGLPGPLAVLLTTIVMVLLMTYAVMPLVIRVLSPWLFAGR